MKKVLLTSAVALAAFGFAQNASAATTLLDSQAIGTLPASVDKHKVLASYDYNRATNTFTLTYADGTTTTVTGVYARRAGDGTTWEPVTSPSVAEAVTFKDRNDKVYVELFDNTGDQIPNPAVEGRNNSRNPQIKDGFIRYDRDAKHGFTKRARITVVDGGGKPVKNATVDVQIIGVNGDYKQYEVFTVKTDENGDADFSVNDYYKYNGKFVKEAVDADGTKLGYPAMQDANPHQLIDPTLGDVAGNIVQEPVTTDNESEALKFQGSVMFKPGEKLKYRVATTAANHKEVVELEGQLTITNDMYTNGRVVLPYKDDSRAGQIGDATTAAQYGWAKTAEGWKYFENAKAVTGWKQVDGSWYYLNDKGVMQTGWVNVSGTWYYLNKSGAMVTGWVQDSGTWYFLEASGAMKASQWFQVGDKWYYVNGSGALKVNQWFQVGDKWYYATESGAIAVNTTVGGYTVDASGAWVK